jgi:hypothetical protein
VSTRGRVKPVRRAAQDPAHAAKAFVSRHLATIDAALKDARDAGAGDSVVLICDPDDPVAPEWIRAAPVRSGTALALTRDRAWFADNYPRMFPHVYGDPVPWFLARSGPTPDAPPGNWVLAVTAGVRYMLWLPLPKELLS